MYTINVWTAGQRISTFIKTDIEAVKETVSDQQQKLNEGAIWLQTVGTTMLVKEICIDVLRDGKIFAQHSFKVK